ncbi:MAG: OmpH family outer membrane protein [Oleiphilaceae bacterium]|nr:OmpH family outer membrane protein [Oleiphilaceae bacterium]
MFRVSFLTGLLAVMVSVPTLAETRIGVVDLRKALFSSENAQVFSQQLQRDFASEETKVRETQEAAQKLKDRLEKDSAMMNESERQQLTAEFQNKVREFNGLKQRLDSTVASRKQEFLEEARPGVDAAVRELVDENNLDIMLPAEAVVFAKPTMDLTESLLEKLNQ